MSNHIYPAAMADKGRGIGTFCGWQVFELWEGPAADDGTSKHYVRVLFNKEDLALAKHPKGKDTLVPLPGQCPSTGITTLQTLLSPMPEIFLHHKGGRRGLPSLLCALCRNDAAHLRHHKGHAGMPALRSMQL